MLSIYDKNFEFIKTITDYNNNTNKTIYSYIYTPDFDEFEINNETIKKEKENYNILSNF